MIGVIVVPGASPAMHGLDADRSLALLPLGDRPALQHVVESLVAQGILRIEFIVGHAPQRVEALFGNGDRWGSRFRYHLAADPDHPYRSLRVISEIKTESWLLLHAERFPIVDFEAVRNHETTLYYEADETILSGDSGDDPLGSLHWGGAARFPLESNTGTSGIDDFANFTPTELTRYFEDRALAGSATVIATARWIDVATPANLLLSQTKLLHQKLKGHGISGLEIQPNVWVSRNTLIHPDVTLNAPVYIGPNTRVSHGVTLGPNTVVGSNCFIDSNTSIENSLILMGSYIGQSLELNHTVVARSLLVNVRLDTTLDIEEDFLLGRVTDPNRRSPLRHLVQSVVALLLFVLFLPISLLSLAWFVFAKRIPLTTIEMETIPLADRPVADRTIANATYDLPCIGKDAWAIPRKAGWSAFTRQFLPGLIAVFLGEVGFVGLPPRTRASIESLSPEWADLYTDGKSGLITEASIAATDRADDMQLYLADAYYAVRHSWQHDLKLALRYFAALVLPRP
jgi:NDP-sugar pyrophosphorylase family protein